jgi:truncated hemoglobin YjbI
MLKGTVTVRHWLVRTARIAFAAQNYTGRSMSEPHKHLKITEGEWAPFCKDFDDTMAEFNVPEAEHKELFAIVQSTKGHIVDTSS